MSIFEDLSKFPGTIPFFGVPAGIELQVNDEKRGKSKNKPMFKILITFPMGVDDIDEVANKLAIYFDGTVMAKEKHQITISVDTKTAAYTLLYSFRDAYHTIKTT